MSIVLFLGQMWRSRKKTILNVLLLMVVTAFFCMSLNLYRNSTKNLQMAEETFSTIAVMELYGNVDRKGRLTDPNSESSIGFQNVAVDGYDLSEIVQASGVEDYDLRVRYGAYIPDEVALQKDMIDGRDAGMSYGFMNGTEIIRFKTYQDNEYHLPFDDGESFYEGPPIRLEVLDNADSHKIYHYTVFIFHYMSMDMEDAAEYADEIRKFNRCDVTDELILYPDTEYLLVIRDPSQWIPTQEDETVYANLFNDNGNLFIFFDDYGAEEYYPAYNARGYSFSDSTGGTETHQVAPFWRWEDIEADPALKAYFEAAWESVDYNQCAFSVTAVNDVQGVPAFHLGNAYLQSGRMITAEEYASGARVCMVTSALAHRQGWEVGDTLDMNFFEYEGFVNSDFDEDVTPIYHQYTEGFFDRGTYEIVGIFEQKEMVGTSEMSESTLTVAWNTIYVPKNSLQNAPEEAEQPVHGSLLTIWLENQSVNDFLNDMDDLGVNQEQPGRYTAKFTIYDQGYSTIQHSLQSMHSTARLLLGLSSILLVVTCLLLTCFLAQGHRHNVGILRMLGGSKGRAVICVMLCGLLIAAIGAAAGAGIGYRLTDQVGQGILARSDVQEEDPNEFRSFLVSEDTELELFTEAERQWAILAGLAGGVFFLGLLLCFVMGYIGKEPRELLPQSRE